MIDWEDSCARESAGDGAQALGIRVSRMHVRALLPGVPGGNEKVGAQMRRVLRALKKLYPPDGKVPDDISTEVVRGQVNKELSADSRNRGASGSLLGHCKPRTEPRLYFRPQRPHNPHCGACGDDFPYLMLFPAR